jgi:hypothetical protein
VRDHGVDPDAGFGKRVDEALCEVERRGIVDADRDRGSCQTTLGSDGSVTSSTEKQIGGFSFASYMIGRPSRLNFIAMPSPILG